MKKIILSLLISCIALSLAAQQKSILIPEKVKWKNHLTADKLLRVRMPTDWEPDEKFMTFNLFLKAPYESDDDHFAENISIYFQEMKGNLPDEMLKKYIAEAKLQIVRLLGDSNMSEPRFFSLKGTPACEFSCVSTQDGMKMKWKQLCIVKGERIFTLTFTASFDDFSRYVQIADIIMQSVEIK